MATGNQSIPPELQALVNRVRQLARSIQQTGSASPDSIPQALALAQDARSQLAGFSNSSFISQSSIDQATADLDEATATLNTVQQEELASAQTQSPVSAGQTASDDASNGPNAPAAAQVDASGRIVAPPNTTTPTNADTPTTSDNGGDTGLDAPVRTTEQTQATNGYDQGINIRAEDGTLSSLRRNPETGELYDASGLPGGVDLTTESGTLTNDDAKNESSTTQQAAVNGANNTTVKVVAQPNILDEFYSYTYSASVYLMNSAQYRKLLTSKNKSIDGYQLLFQTGGGPPNRGGVRAPPATSQTLYESDGTASTVPPAETSYPDGGRNPFFAEDFYIESITMETLPQGKGAGAAHVNSALKFTVIEPNGITLLDRLYDAVKNHAPTDANGKVNYQDAEYLMVIRFYGYNQEGQLVYPIAGKPDPEGTSDSAAAVEKFIPFKLKQLNWSVGSKLVSYEWDCVPVGFIIGGYTGRGTIPYDIQLVDSTVGGLLAGDAKYGTGTAPNANPGKSTTLDKGGRQTSASDPRVVNQAATPAKADAAPTTKKTITQGLMGAMNDFQAKLVQDGIYTIADHYSIEFVDGVGMPATAISGAKLQLPNVKIDKSKTASGQNDAKGIDPDKQSVDMVTRSFSIVAGQQLLQAIELVIRNSSYITDQALVTLQPDGTYEPNPNNRNKPMKWFTINMVATKIGDKIDPYRNDYAYDIKYVVAPFRVENFNSKYFPISTFPGVHKSYPYWFTGQNTAVLDYQETLNSLYALTVSGNDPKNRSNAQREAFTASMAEIVKFHYDPRSAESSQQADGKSNEIGANAAEVLYSATDLKETKVKILGDPAWIMQGSLFRDVGGSVFTGKSATSGFLPDGSVNFDASQVLFEIKWQRPEDYDLSTGLADPYSKTQKLYNNRMALQSRVYLCKKVVSEFRQGKFEQTLEGAIYLFPIPGKTNTANPSAAGSLTDNNSADAGRPSNTASAVKANQTAATQGRTGLLLAGRVQANAQTDPRSFLSADGGTAAMLGAQQVAAGGPSAGTLTPKDGGTAFITDSTTSNAVQPLLRNANPPAPATDGDGNPISLTIGGGAGGAGGAGTGANATTGYDPSTGTVGTTGGSGGTAVVSQSTFNGPPRLPGAFPGQDGLTTTQLAQLEEGMPAGGDDPSSPTNPSNQEIVSDGG